MLATASVFCATLVISGATFARGSEVRDAAAGPGVAGSVALSALPAQAQTLYQRVLAGGPFEGRKDGSTFGNYERALPAAPRGYYREYTVAAPGARRRGARRIVCGGMPPTPPVACYYTADHYATFRRIEP